jgi:hypothetical protein
MDLHRRHIEIQSTAPEELPVYSIKSTMRDSLHQLDALEEPHDLQNAQDLDHAKNALAAAHRGDVLPDHTLLHHIPLHQIPMRF